MKLKFTLNRLKPCVQPALGFVALLLVVAAGQLIWDHLASALSGGGVSMAMAFNATNCDPRMISVDDAMSLTRASITGWTQTDIEANFFKEVGLDKIIAQTKEARMAGVKERSLTDLLLSRTTALKEGKSSGSPSVIAPFSLVPRRNQVNPNYFRISAGVAAAGGGPDAHWKLTVNNGSVDADSSPWAKSPNNVLKNIEKYFLKGHYMNIQWVGAANVSKTVTMRVISSTNIDANSCYVVVAPNKTYAGDVDFGGNNAVGVNGWWEVASGAQKANFQPTGGVLQMMVNSVSDYQSYGQALPGFNDFGLLEYWQQTNRWVHKYNDAYVEALNAATTSEGLRKFRLLPLAKLRAQQENIHQNWFYNTCFLGEEINEKQTTTDWQSLPKVYDPAWAASGESGSLALEYQANTLGFRTQISRCGNVLDQQGGPLDLDAVFEAGYNLKREREGESGATVDRIDAMCDLRGTRAQIRQLMMKYYKAKYSADLTLYAELNKKIGLANGAQLADWSYDLYQLPDHGFELAVISDQYFDDRIAAFPAAHKTRGRGLWMLDWSDIMVNIIRSKSVPRTNNLADDVYKYVIEQNVQHVMLNSKTFEVRVGNTNRHRIIENFSDATPKLTVPAVDLAG
jgi:hypothetical protein